MEGVVGELPQMSRECDRSGGGRGGDGIDVDAFRELMMQNSDLFGTLLSENARLSGVVDEGKRVVEALLQKVREREDERERERERERKRELERGREIRAMKEEVEFLTRERDRWRTEHQRCIKEGGGGGSTQRTAQAAVAQPQAAPAPGGGQ